MKSPLLLINNPPNVFDPVIVHRDLEDNKSLWKHAAYIRQTAGIFGQEGLEATSIHYYLVVVPGTEERLIEMAARWKPGKVQWANTGELRRLHIK